MNFMESMEPQMSEHTVKKMRENILIYLGIKK